jgi:hypothetical protein
VRARLRNPARRRGPDLEMRELVAALGLALAIEGILLACFPDGMKRAMMDAAAAPRDRMRLVGLGSAVLGVAIVWAARRVFG